MKSGRLQGKVVWITGASSGIGEAMAYQVARNRGRLVLSARRVPELRRVKEKCLACNPGLRDEDILVLKMDVTKTETHQSCFTQVIQHFGAVSTQFTFSTISVTGTVYIVKTVLKIWDILPPAGHTNQQRRQTAAGSLGKHRDAGRSSDF